MSVAARRSAWPGLAVLVVTIAVGGCGIDAAGTPFPGTLTVVDPAGGWSMRVPSPPWEVVKANDPSDVQLDVPARVFTVAYGPVPTYTLDIGPASGTASDECAERAEAIRAAGGTVAASGQAVEGAGALAGLEVVSTQELSQGDPSTVVNQRDVYFDAPIGSYHLAFVSVYALDGADIDALVASFALGTPPP